MLKTIDLQSGTQTVQLSEIPRLLAKATIPAKPDSDWRITLLRKIFVPYGMPYHEEDIPPQDLTDDDWKLVKKTWADLGLPPYQNGMSESEWLPYEKAFEEAVEERKLDWQLSPLRVGLEHLLENIESRHKVFLDDAISKMEVIGYDQLTHLPSSEEICKEHPQMVHVLVGDFMDYAQKFDIQVLVGGAGAGQAVASHETNSNEKFISKAEQQDKIILSWLTEHSYDPLSLPAGACGKKGIRNACGDDVCKNMGMFSSRSVYDSAWDRLRANGKTKVASKSHHPE